MRKFVMLFWLLLGGIAVSAQDAFITQWNLSLHAGSGANQIQFVATIATGDATYTWETIPAGTSGSGTLAAGTTVRTITGIPADASIRLEIEPQNLQRFFINNGADRHRLVDVLQWGDAAWTSMQNAFYGCENLQITASDIPDLALAQGLIQMFRGCLLLDGPSNIGSWNTSNVTNMQSMFQNANSFNQNIGSWNTGNVFTMNSMFRGAQSFNQDIGNWNIGNVTNMQSMFDTAISFNQDIGNWNTGNVTNMQAMFDYAISFNQPILNWSTANVANMLNMFRTAISFDQAIGNWNTTNVTNMSGMFGNAISFNQDIGNWTLNSNVFMTQMFDGSGMSCDSYSSTLIGWSNNPNTPINRSLGAGGLSYGTNAENARNYLINDKFWSVNGDFPSGQSCPPIPFTTLWDMSIPTGESGNENNIGFWATVASGDADYNWETIPSGSSGSGTLTEGTAYRIISGIPSGAMIRLNIMPQNIQQFYMDNTSHRRRLVDIERWGNVVWTSLERAFYGCENLDITADDIPDLSQTTSLLLTFTDCYSLNGPVNIGMWNTENISDMRNTFQNALLFNQDIGSWNTVNVTNMQHLFDGAVAFNQDINNWNLSNVTDMSYMFYNATSFNYSLNNWNTVGVTDMNRMFSGASAFNGQIGLWNTSNVTNMSNMFSAATSFNQPIGNWNTENVTSMLQMFQNTTSFNQVIGNWNTANVNNMQQVFNNAAAFNKNLALWTLNIGVNMNQMFDGSGMSCENYSHTLIGWNNNPNTPSNRVLGANGLQYGTNAESARNNLITNKGWTINGDAPSSVVCEPTNYNLILEVSPTASGVVSGDGQYIEGANVSITATANPGWQFINWTDEDDNVISLMENFMYTMPAENATLTANFEIFIPITGHFITQWDLSLDAGSGIDQIQFNATIATGDASYTWETIPAGTSGSGFLSAGTALHTITGIPAGSTISLAIEPQNLQRFYIGWESDRNRLIDVTQWGNAEWISMESTFSGCSNLQISALDIPDLTDVQNMNEMFVLCPLLNGPTNIGDWNTENVINISSMFAGATNFNQNIGSWDTGNVTNMSGTFAGAINFNQNIGSWNTSSVSNMANMFENAYAFNHDIGSWNTGNVFNMNFMFRNAGTFNQNISGWNTTIVTNMANMFENAHSFNQNIGNWNTGNVTNMSGMFSNATSFNQPIGTWNTSSVANMDYMFGSATSFNQDISNWNTGNVTNMEYMFGNATSFNQDIGNWTLNTNVNMQFMFNFSGMSCESYDNTLTGWNDNPSTPNNRNLGAQGLIYWQGQSARNNLINNKGWTISGDSYDNCNYMHTCVTFTWTGGAGLWNDPLNWSLGFVPDTCNNVIVVPSGDITVPSGFEGFAKSIINEGHITVEQNAVLNVVGWHDNDLPIIETYPVTNITSNSAMSGGYLFNEGRSPITQRGIVWSTTTAPATNNNEGMTNDGIGMGAYHSEMTGLMPNTTYFVRAYATNSYNTAYGGELSFATESTQVEITFQVDMSNEVISPLGVHIAGSFQGWNPSTTQMTDIGNSVYAITIIFNSGDYIEYKFINGNAWGMNESVPFQCANGGNRYLTVPAVNTTINLVCYGSCDPCGPPPIQVQVTFMVDMTNEIVSPDGVHIAGSFQGWNPGSTPMTDTGNNIYSYTITLPSGTYQEYKFVNGNTWVQAENVPPQCSNGLDRYFVVPAVPIVIDNVCFGSCGPCN